MYRQCRDGFCVQVACDACHLQGSEKQSEVRIKKFMTMMDSMTEEELNTNDLKLLQQPSRIARIAKGAGRHPQDYFELLGEASQMHLCIRHHTSAMSIPDVAICGGKLCKLLPCCQEFAFWTLYSTGFTMRRRAPQMSFLEEPIIQPSATTLDVVCSCMANTCTNAAYQKC